MLLEELQRNPLSAIDSPLILPQYPIGFGELCKALWEPWATHSTASNNPPTPSTNPMSLSLCHSLSLSLSLSLPENRHQSTPSPITGDSGPSRGRIFLPFPFRHQAPWCILCYKLIRFGLLDSKTHFMQLLLWAQSSVLLDEWPMQFLTCFLGAASSGVPCSALPAQ